MTRPSARHAAVLLALALGLSACGTDDQPGAAADGAALDVAVGFYPMQYLVERLAGEGARVESLTAPGSEPHDLELTPQQVAGLTEVDLVVYVAGFQPAVDEAVEQQGPAAFDGATALDLLPGYQRIEDGEQSDTGIDDPHVWLDPARFADVADALAVRLGEIAPDRAQDFTSAAADLRTDLEQLDADYTAGLADCERRELFTNHNAFGYLADAYDLDQVAVTGLTPEQEASSGRLAEVADIAREAGATVIFFEETASPAVAESLAAEVGAQAQVLSPLEGAPEEGDYLDQMRANLSTIQTALGCS